MRKGKLDRKGMAVFIVLGILLMGTVFPEAALKVQAAETPIVIGLEVAASSDGTGIIARCSYSNYTD